jgi:hypothetical protein
MSGLPALRCFIFFAADLIILILPSFDREALIRKVRPSSVFSALSSFSIVKFALEPQEA